MRVHVHISETRGEHNDCIARHGKTPVALLNDLGVLDGPVMAAHCVWVSDGDMEIMAAKNTSVLSCPGSNLKLGSGIAPVAKMIERGINVSCGTDSAASNNNLSMMEEMTLLALLQKGVNLDAALIPAARRLLRRQRSTVQKRWALNEITGSLEVGKQADIIVLDTKGVRYYAASTDLLESYGVQRK